MGTGPDISDSIPIVPLFHLGFGECLPIACMGLAGLTLWSSFGSVIVTARSSSYYE
jgi:hypothetical protein